MVSGVSGELLDLYVRLHKFRPHSKGPHTEVVASEMVAPLVSEFVVEGSNLFGVSRWGNSPNRVLPVGVLADKKGPMEVSSFLVRLGA